jgi:beta-lactamase regulating signal transducer with metallopeptidase domain/nitrous oxidase accessory protein NosD
LLLIAARVGWAIVHSIWLAAAAAMALALALCFLRSAAARHIACMFALAITLGGTGAVTMKVPSPATSSEKEAGSQLPPAAPSARRDLPLPNSNDEDPSRRPITLPAANGALPQSVVHRSTSLLDSKVTGAGLAATTSFRSLITPALPWLAVSWLLGVVLLSLRHFGGWWRVRTWRRTGKRLVQEAAERLASEIGRKLGLRRLVPIMKSADVLTPMLVGTVRPMILLPLRVITGFSVCELEAILAHELAHLARGDAWANLLQIVCETLLFYHPGVWWISRQARIERENAADDLATAVCADRLQYVNALARLAEQTIAPSLALAATDGPLLTRIRRLLLPPPRPSGATSDWAVSALIAGGLFLVMLILIPHPSSATAEEPPKITVAAGESIQKAIDAAPAGAVIQLGEGEWRERITISKPLTIEGAGWEKTSIKPDRFPPGVTAKSKAEFRARYVRGLSVTERAVLDREWVEKFARPTLLVQVTGDVVVRGLRIGGIAPPSDQSAGGEALAVFRKAQGSMSGCAVVGPSEDGIQIDDGSDVEIVHSLVAALRGVGIIVEGWNASSRPSRLHLAESEVRTVADGVQIGRNCDGTLIERCRIRDSRGNGIYYEEASPTITGNAIFNNKRSGIHAHGKTHATVRGNLVWKNKSHGMECWFENADTIEGNTFVENVQAALLAVGNSKPVAVRNIFAASPVAINCGMVGPQIGQPVLTANLFWQTATVLKAMEEKKPAPEGSLSADPQFRDAAKEDFALAPSSPAIGANIGLPEPLAPASPWRTLPEEEAIATSATLTSDTSDVSGFPEVKMDFGLSGLKTIDLSLAPQVVQFEGFLDSGPPPRFISTNSLARVDLVEVKESERPSLSKDWLYLAQANVIPPSSTNQLVSKTPEELRQKAVEDAKAWIDDAFQLEDKAKREAAIERIRAAMRSGNADEARAGVTAFVRLAPIEFDKAAFRPEVRALLASQDRPTRAAAASAFTMTGADADDVERILALADDPAAEVREPLTGIIVRLTKGDLTGKPASDAILKLMNNLPRDSRSVAHAMWGVKFSPEIEARVLEFCREIQGASNSSVGYNFFYGALSTQANKSDASCRRLIELLAHQDTTNIAGRSAWGLQQGVAREQFPLVADAMVKLIEARSDGYLRNNALRCLRTYGDVRQAPPLKALLAKPGVTGEFKSELQQLLAAIEKRRPESAADQSSDKPLPSPTPQPPTPQLATTATEKAEIEVEWQGKWWPAAVLKKEAERTQIHYVGYGSEWDEWVNQERIRPLQSQTAAPEKSTTGVTPQKAEETRVAQLVEKNRQAARRRAQEDRQRYTFEELGEIEKLYQVANTKGKRTDEAKASLKQLLEKYDKANRTGCATLYLGQASEGTERLEYLTRAVEKFSDCYYLNGCQVGGYGRYVLALTLWDKGERDKARALLAELKTTYKDATDHRGEPMSKIAEAVEKELAKQQ